MKTFLGVIILTLFCSGVYAQPNLNGYYYKEIVQATAPYRVGVGMCVQDLGTVLGCNAGTNNIPAAITSGTGAIATLTVTNGIITVIPAAQNGITAADTYILTPTIDANGMVAWTESGGGVTAGYTK